MWGVERFVSEDETRAIDVDETTAATARAGGLPTIRFEHATYPREVWLWRDEMVQDPTVDRVLTELERSLSRAGLPVRVGTFTDTPALILWREGQEFSTLVLEGHRQSALVVILTDGYGMQLAAASELEKNTLVNMLRAFGEWPADICRLQLWRLRSGSTCAGLWSALHCAGGYSGVSRHGSSQARCHAPYPSRTAR